MAGHYAPSVISTIAENLTERFTLVRHGSGGALRRSRFRDLCSRRERARQGVLALDPYFFREEPARTNYEEAQPLGYAAIRWPGNSAKCMAA